MINPNLSQMALNITADICSGESQRYSIDCLNKWFCPQISHYYWTTGLMVVLIYIIGSWLLWAFWSSTKAGFLGISWDRTYQDHPELLKILGDLRTLEGRMAADSWIRDKMAKLLIGFIVVFLWLNR